MDVAASRRQLLLDSLGIMVSGVGFGLVYGLGARAAGFSPLEAGAMSVLVFAGASQFVAVGYVLGGFSWAAIVLFTAFLNARHLLYAAALAPYVTKIPRWRRALMAHVLTDEAFALALAHFRRVGRSDERGYWLGAVVSDFIPWNLGTLAGVTIGGSIPDPTVFGLDVIFPASMGGLAVALITERRELVAALASTLIGVGVALAWDLSAGIIAGGVVGPLLAMAVKPAHDHADQEVAATQLPDRAGRVHDDPEAGIR